MHLHISNKSKWLSTKPSIFFTIAIYRLLSTKAQPVLHLTIIHILPVNERSTKLDYRKSRILLYVFLTTRSTKPDLDALISMHRRFFGDSNSFSVVTCI